MCHSIASIIGYYNKSKWNYAYFSEKLGPTPQTTGTFLSCLEDVVMQFCKKVDDKHTLNWSNGSFYPVHVDLHDAKCVKELGQELE